jgi:hypothetical protein
MIKMSQLFELPTVYEALSPSPKLLLRAFLFYPFKKLMGRLRKRWEEDNPSSFCMASGVGQKS